MAISQAKKLELITKHAKKFTVKPGGSSCGIRGRSLFRRRFRSCNGSPYVTADWRRA